MKSNLVLSLILTATVTGFAVAGPYSTAQIDTNNAIDAAIPAFVNGDINPVFVAWATECVDYSPAPDVAAPWQDTEKALGPATGGLSDIVALGDLDEIQIGDEVPPGEITLGFAWTIYNGEGADFAVFENGSLWGLPEAPLFAELAYVEVSSDGDHFARFPCVSLTEGRVGAYGCIDPTDVYNLAGKHAVSYGTPFDLEDLADDPLVLQGFVDLDSINYVKFVDIPGTGDYYDSQATPHPIYDAWETWGAGGLDLEAVGAINAIPEPSMIVLLIGLATMVMWHRRKGFYK